MTKQDSRGRLEVAHGTGIQSGRSDSLESCICVEGIISFFDTSGPLLSLVNQRTTSTGAPIAAEMIFAGGFRAFQGLQEGTPMRQHL